MTTTHPEPTEREVNFPDDDGKDRYKIGDLSKEASTTVNFKGALTGSVDKSHLVPYCSHAEVTLPQIGLMSGWVLKILLTYLRLR